MSCECEDCKAAVEQEKLLTGNLTIRKLSPGVSVQEPLPREVPYAFNEDKILEELKTYIDKPYSGHYSKGIQVTDFIMSHAETPDFYKGNVLKYICRYGFKDGHNRNDLLKAIHYCIMMVEYHDRNFKDKT